jgi:hypothetical protein
MEDSVTKQIKSIRLAATEIEWLQRYGRSFTAQFIEDLAILRQSLRRAEAEIAGKFTVEEACLLVDLLNGHLLAPEFFDSLGHLLAEEVLDSCSLDGLDRKWGVDGRQLAEKCRSLTPWQAYAVHHLARLFWAGLCQKYDIREAVSDLFHC